MSSNDIKRAIGFAVLGLGILAGMISCVMYPGAMFVVGANDTPQEVWAMTFDLVTPFLACTLALWKRFIAGVWLVFVGSHFL